MLNDLFIILEKYFVYIVTGYVKILLIFILFFSEWGDGENQGITVTGMEFFCNAHLNKLKILVYKLFRLVLSAS